MLQHRTTYRNNVIPDSLSSLVLVVVASAAAAHFPSSSTRRVTSQRRGRMLRPSLVYISLSPSFSLSLSCSRLRECARHNRTLRPRTLYRGYQSACRRPTWPSSTNAKPQKSKSLHSSKPPSLLEPRHCKCKLKSRALKSAARTGGDGHASPGWPTSAHSVTIVAASWENLLFDKIKSSSILMGSKY